MFINLLIYILSFVLLWVGSGLAVSSVDKMAKKLRVSSFAAAFLFLGILTSIPELSIGLNAIAEGDPEIFVGNLLGATMVIFILLMPLLAIFGKGIKIEHKLDKNSLIFSLFVITLPALTVLDKSISVLEGVLLIISYIVLIIYLEQKNGLFKKTGRLRLLNWNSYSLTDFVKLVIGVVIIFGASKVIIDQTIYFSEVLTISVFNLGLLVLAIGTNMPEISIAVRAVISGRKDVAFGDYLGSAATNTALFGLFTLINRGEILTSSNYLMTTIFIVCGMSLFYIFARSKNEITAKEGWILFIVYLAFFVVEMI